MAFRVYKSNRPERLADALAELLRTDAPGCFAPEWISIQSRGMDVWLAMELAQRLGIQAHVESHFPRSLIEKLLARALDIDPKTAPRFDEESLSFAVMAALPSLLSDPALAELRAYLANDPRGVRLPQLARRIAGVFDRYSVFRPELLDEFEAKPDPTDWQAVLFRALPEALRSARIPALARRLSERLREGGFTHDELPSRVSLFGVSSLPPLFVEILRGLSEHLEVHLFVSSPSEEYWADTRRRRSIRGTTRTDDPGDDHRETGHPLLSSFGRLSRDFQEVLEGGADYEEPPGSLFEDAGTDTLLHAMQSDILRLRNRGASHPDAPPLPLRAADASISIHDAHGPLREVEILHDQLTHALESDPSLAPEDILVLTPDLETYGPLVEAVFGGRGDGEYALPFRLSERPLRHGSAINEAFLALLGLAKRRLSSLEVLDFATLEPVRMRFELEAAELEQIATWVRESGVRYARDEAHRKRLGQPEERANTWAFGFDRLFLGYAAPAEDRRLYRGVLAYDEIEGSDAQVLGRFAELCQRLFAALDAFGAPRSVAEWAVVLRAHLGQMLDATGDHAGPHQALREILFSLGERAEEAGFTAPLGLDALLCLLAPHVSEAVSARGFLAGGITFSELLPLRGIPFRVIALLGLNDGSFPRRPVPASFDRVAAAPKRGDRSVRDEDLQQFLETLLSARERLIITYSGQSPSGPSQFPPSVVVGALLDCVSQGFFLEDQPGLDPLEARKAVEERLVRKHPLQAHSPRYFRAAGEPGLVSYEARHAQDAAALIAAREPPPPFLDQVLPAGPAPDSEIVELSLDDLVRFFQNPAKVFGQRRLGLELQLEEEALEEREALALNGLENHRLITRSVEALLAGVELTQLGAVLAAEGLLPHGTQGQLTLADVLGRDAAPLAELARRHQATTGPAHADIELTLGAVRLTGRVTLGAHGGLFHLSGSKLKPKYRLGAWIQHLALLSARGTSAAESRAVMVGRGDKGGAAALSFSAPSEPGRLLRELVELWGLGQRAPLPFFPACAHDFAASLAAAPEARDDAIKAARGPWYPSWDGTRPGEGADPYVVRVFGSSDLFALPAPEDAPAELQLDFEDLALRVMSPLLAHTEEEPA